MNAQNDHSKADSDHDTNPLHSDIHNDDYYTLSAEYHGTVRLALQQFIWSQSLGFDIHPSIQGLPPNASVAEVACGTALWLVNVGRQLGPSSDLHGFDIYLNQAPPQQWLPPNLTLHKWNFFDQVPPEFVGRFDLVHVRLITVAVHRVEDIERVIRNLCKLLKPGGHLQWDEASLLDACVVKASPDLHVPLLDELCALQALTSTERRRRGLPSLEWHTTLCDLLRSNGFTNAERFDLKEQFIERKELLRYNSDQLLMMLEQYARRAYAPGHPAGLEVLRLVERAAKDSEKGAALVMPPLCWVARKGSS